jgi:hypothetical protein
MAGRPLREAGVAKLTRHLMTTATRRPWMVVAVAGAVAALGASLVEHTVVFDLRPARYDLSVERFASGVQAVEVGTQPGSADLPYILPGPADAWAGGGPHTLRFHMATWPDRRLVLELWAVETHDQQPPVLTIALDQAVVAVVHTRRGTGRPPPHHGQGVRSRYQVTVPSPTRDAAAGGATLSITATSGSWVMWERIRLRERLPTLAPGELARAGPPPLISALALGASLAALVAGAVARARQPAPTARRPGRCGAGAGLCAGLVLLVLGWAAAAPDSVGLVGRVPRWTWLAAPWLLMVLPLALVRLAAWRARVVPDLRLAPAAAPRALSVRELVGAGLAYMALTLVLTRPGVARFTTHFMADGGDGFNNVWGLWWVKTALLAGQWPWWTDRLFAPDGVSLYFHTLAFPLGVLSLPFQLVFPITVAHNVVVVTTFVLGGLAVYGLVRSWVADERAAFLAGSLYTFSPFHFAQGIGHLSLIAVFWLPFYVWALLRACRTGAVRHAAVAGAVLVGALLTDYYATLYCLLLTPLIAWWQRSWRAPLGSLIAAGVLGLPFALPMLRTWLTVPFVGAHNATAASADLLAWFVPGPNSLWAPVSEPVWRAFSLTVPSESGLYLGIVPLVIVALSWYAGVPGVPALVFGAGLFALLAMGPWLHVGGWISSVPLPYQLLQPFLKLAGVPARTGVVVYLGLALAVGIGTAALWRRRTPRQRWAIFVVLLGLLLLDYAPQPYQTALYHVPAFYVELGRQPDEGETLMDLPPHPHGAFPAGMLYQTVHGRRLLGGHLARFPKAQFESFYTHPVIRFLVGSVSCSEELRRDMRSRLRQERVRWIIGRTAAHHALGECLGLRPVTRDGMIVIGPLS